MQDFKGIFISVYIYYRLFCLSLKVSIYHLEVCLKKKILFPLTCRTLPATFFFFFFLSYTFIGLILLVHSAPLHIGTIWALCTVPLVVWGARGRGCPPFPPPPAPQRVVFNWSRMVLGFTSFLKGLW